MGTERHQLTLGKYVSGVQSDYALSIGGVADYYIEVASVVELASAVSGAIAAQLPYLVIGGGNRVLFSDGGYPGLLIRNRSSSLVRSADHSQIIVDSGMPLSQLVTQTAAWELGGLTPFYGQTATVGGALYADLAVGGSRFAASLRSVTVLMPPTRLKLEAKIARHPASWLFDPKENGSRLHRLRVAADPFGLAPILLSATLQLTNNRSSELMGQIRRSSSRLSVIPRGAVGPLFEPLLEGDLDSLLRPLAKAIKSGAVSLDHHAPNYARARGRMRASDLRIVIEAVEAKILESAGIRLRGRYEYMGVW